MGLLIQPFLGIVVKILAAKISVFQPNDQIFSLKKFIGFQVADRAVMRMLIMFLVAWRGVFPDEGGRPRPGEGLQADTPLNPKL